ncbi:PAS domain S-box protein [Methanosarcina hadiensis]|uniref:PAS domain S-box protein n=1 Tax=Methanosarcina hadiensis TaxID=3078083 RepID=UPI003977D076
MKKNGKGKMRKSGIDIIGDIPWGTHFCQFYQTEEDLIEIVVPYFKAGLENSEFCMWITSQPLSVDEAKEALRKSVPDIDDHINKGQIEIIPHEEWYLKEGVFDSERVLNGWVEKLNNALENGYDGLRLSGNTFWLEKRDWDSFVDYEKEIDRILGNYRMIALCTYCLDRCSSTGIIDVVVNHQFALIKKEGEWERIESSRSKKAEEAAVQAARNWEYTFDAVPDLIAILDDRYRIVRANRAMASKLNVTPEECIGLTCYEAVHGSGEPPSFCPHRQLLKDGLEHTTEVCEDCLGGYFLVSVSPLHDSEGKLIGSVHVARDINERKQTEKALHKAYENLQVQSEELQAQSEELKMQNEELQAQTEELIKAYRTLNESEKRFELLSNANSLLLSSKEPESIIQTIAEKVMQHLNCDVFFNYVLDEVQGRLHLNACGGINAEAAKEIEWLDKGSAICGCVALNGCRIISEDVQHNDDRRADLVRSMGIQAYACHPLHIGENTIGTLSFGTKSRKEFTGDELAFMSTVADQVSVAIERKRAEEMLERSNQRINEILNSIQDDFYVLDRDLNFVYASKQFTSKIGKEPKDFVGKNIWKMFPKYTGTDYEENLNTVMDKREIRRFEMSGRYTDAYYSMAVFPSAEGITVLGTDITEQKKIEETLRESEARRKVAEAVEAERQRLFDVLETLPAMICLLTPDYHVAFANRSFREKFGESEGRHCYEYCYGRTKPCEFCETYRVLETGQPHHWETIGPDGSSIDAYNFPFTDADGSSMILEMKIDITERKRAEVELKKHREHLEELVKEQTAELAEREERFRTLAENSPDMIARFDRQNRHLYVNPASAEIYGCPQEKVVGKTHCELGRNPEQVKFWEEHHEKVFVTGKSETMEFEYTSPQGKKYYFNTRIVPEFDGGEVSSVLAISRDITDIKEAEIRLKETLDNLEVLVEERTSKLEKAYRSLKESEKGLAEAQRVAHLGNWNWSIVTNELYWSDEIYRIFGRSPQEFGATYDAFLSYVHPDDRDYVKNAVNGALAGKPYSIDHRIILASGEERIVHEQGEVIFGNGNVPVRMTGVVQDITERKKAEKALELANSYNRSLIEASLDPLVTIGPDGKITDVNRATEMATGYNRSELIGTDFSDYFTDPGKAREGYQQVFREGSVFDYALEIHHRNRKTIPVLYNASVYRDENGEVIGVFAAARDVTELKKVEKELEIASKYNRSLIEASLDPLVTIGPDGKITDVNEATESVTGYSRKELTGTDFSNYFTEPEKAKEGYKQVFREGLVRDYALEIQHRGGHTTPVLYNASVYRDEDDEVIGIFAAARDITELKKAEQKIQTLANAVESSEDAIITKSLEGIITSWNRGAEQIYGYAAEEILGKPVSMLEPDNHKGEIEQLIKKIKQGKRVQHYETSRLKKDGTAINISITLSPVFSSSGELVAISAIARDVTERKKAEEALRLSNIYNRSLIEASLDPLVTIGPEGKITDVNRATELVTGYNRSELIGTDFSDYFIDPERAREGYQQVFREGSVFDYALEIQHRDGKITPVLYNASIYRDEFGEVIGIFAAARDITERKKAERMLELKLEELARSNAELEQFAYVASHDLQEPLRMVVSYLQLLQRKYQGELDSKADKYIYFAVDGASRMQVLINDLLEFSRVTTKAREFEPADCRLILGQVLSDLEISIKESGTSISYGPLPVIMADSTQLAQVFQNLINNAIKFRSKEDPQIRISAEKKADHWLFSVQDNGIGIDPKYSERIFEVFKRLHKREEYPGTGIGLSICKKIIERHGGHIWVESEPGRGSTFYFTLPVN